MAAEARADERRREAAVVKAYEELQAAKKAKARAALAEMAEGVRTCAIS
jgi:hypothetical protein